MGATGEPPRNAAMFCKCYGVDEATPRRRAVRGEGQGHASCVICASYALCCVEHGVSTVVRIVVALRQQGRLWLQGVPEILVLRAVRKALERRAAVGCRNAAAMSGATVLSLCLKLREGIAFGPADAVLAAQLEIDAAMLTPPAGLFADDDEARSLAYRDARGQPYGSLVVLREVHAELSTLSGTAPRTRTLRGRSSCSTSSRTIRWAGFTCC